MRECCAEYEKMIEKLKAIRTCLSVEFVIRDIDEVIAFLKAEYEAHVDRAGEKDWDGD